MNITDYLSTRRKLVEQALDEFYLVRMNIQTRYIKAMRHSILQEVKD